MRLRREGGKERRREGSWSAYREKKGGRRKFCSLKNHHKKPKQTCVWKKGTDNTYQENVYLFFHHHQIFFSGGFEMKSKKVCFSVHMKTGFWLRQFPSVKASYDFNIHASLLLIWVLQNKQIYHGLYPIHLPSLTTAHLRKTMASEKIQKIKQR